jgi:two-component system chemotaxis sensor kinase CheA
MMAESRPPSAIEANLRVLGAVAAAVLAALVLGLILVQQSLVASHRTIETVIVPAHQDIGALQTAMAGMFARQAQISSTTDSSQLAPLRDRSALESALVTEQSEIERELEPRYFGPAVHDRAHEMSAAIRGFLATDDDLLESVTRYHHLREEFARRLAETQASQRSFTEQASAMAGIVQLESILLLRRAAADPSGPRIHELVFGNARTELECVRDLAGAALELSALSGRIGLAPDVDSLNSIAANEVAQTRQKILDRLDDLSDLTTSDSDLAARVAGLRSQLDGLASLIRDETRPDSLVQLRRTILHERARADSIRSASVRDAWQLSDAVRVVRGGVNALSADLSRKARWTGVATGFGVVGLVAIAVAAGLLGARRLRSSVEDLREQNTRLRNLGDALSTLNASLEEQVERRTLALKQRESALQLVLDNTGDGLLSVALDGTVGTQRSRAAVQWFGGAEKPVWDLFFPYDPQRALGLRVAFEQLVEGVLPIAVSVEQMPGRLRQGNRTLDLDWKPIHEEDTVSGIIVVARDVSEALEAEAAEQAARELQGLVSAALRDRSGFADGVADARALIEFVATSADTEGRRRALHTLKGNMATFGFLHFAQACHDVETDVLQHDGRLEEPQVDFLRHEFSSALQAVTDLVGSDVLSGLDVSKEDFGSLVRALEERRDHASILSLISSWLDESVDPVLRRYAGYAKRLAGDLGKELNVVVQGTDVRVPMGQFRSLWGGVTHALRNAVDHGIEAPEERIAIGKPAEGRLTLATEVQADVLRLHIEDDGRGIDFEALRGVARDKGLPSATRDELIASMFVDGVSTKDQVTSISGRGVGMGALRDACRALGGGLDVESSPGRGTRVTARIPLRRASGPYQAYGAGGSATKNGRSAVR